METIFDHDPTAEELRYLAGNWDAKKYIGAVTSDEALTGLCMLFSMRGDDKKSRYYADQISDRVFVQFSLLNGDFISPPVLTRYGVTEK